MSIGDIIGIVRADGFSWLIVIYIICQLVEVSKIEINPITWFWEWVGKRMNSEISKKLNEVENKINEHLKESKEDKIEKTRKEIFEFASLLYKGEHPSIEWHENIMKKCDWYELYCKDNNVPNGVANANIKEIRAKYQIFKQGENIHE